MGAVRHQPPSPMLSIAAMPVRIRSCLWAGRKASEAIALIVEHTPVAPQACLEGLAVLKEGQGRLHGEASILLLHGGAY